MAWATDGNIREEFEMTPSLLFSLVIQPVVAELNWPQPTERAVLLLAIAIQESDLKHRVQRQFGPAKSWWQIEPETAVDCCTRCIPVRKLCVAIGKEYENSDLAACAIAAGILRITKGKLPVVGKIEEAWEYYLRAWRPGKPRPGRWQDSYNTAVRTGAGPAFLAIEPEGKKLAYSTAEHEHQGAVKAAINSSLEHGWIPNT